MALDHNTLSHLPDSLDALEATRNLLLLVIQQLDKITGNRPTSVSTTYTKVSPGAGYVQAEAVQVADDLKSLFDRVERIEAKLKPVSTNDA